MPDLQNLQALLLEIAIEAHKRPSCSERAILRLARVRARCRNGVNSIVIELFLVITSLIASIVLSGFLFGTVGRLSHPAEVTASTASCSSIGTNETCSVTLMNVGSSDTSTSTVCALGHASGQVTSAGVIPAGGSREVGCKVIGVAVSPGGTISGTIPLANGGTVYFVSRA
jgi:hypothetical protein